MKKQVATRYLHKQQQQLLWPQVCETTDGDHFNSTQMKIASVSVLRHTSVVVWRCAQGCGCGFGFRFGFWICYCCWLRGEQELHKIYTVFLRSSRKAYWPRRQSIAWEKYALTTRQARQVNFNNIAHYGGRGTAQKMPTICFGQPWIL